MSADSPAEHILKLEADNRALRRQLIEAQSKVRELELQLASENAAKLRAEEAHGIALTNLNEAWQS
jgi:Mg-chelatase subunit ChlI